MKICLECQTVFDVGAWTCPNCHFQPPLIEGFHAFSPQLALSNDGLADDTHHMLNDLQETSFWFRGRNKIIKDMILKFFPNAADVLEIGCGSGYVLTAIRAALPHAKLTASEIYSYALSYAAERISQPLQLLQMDARQLPFTEEFDLVGAFDVLEHIEEDALVVENIMKSLKPGGGVIFTVPQHPALWSAADDLACHKRRYTRHQLSTLLRAQGFEILLDTSFMFMLLPLMFMQRLKSKRAKNFSLARELSLPSVLDKTFEMVLKLERLAIRAGVRFPVGGSRLVVARKLLQSVPIQEAVSKLSPQLAECV